MWTKYLGLPFKNDGRDRDGLDCWGLVALIYREELGIYLPLYNGIFTDQTPETLVNIHKVMKQESKKWRKIEYPGQFDILLLRTGKHAFHVSIVIDNHRMIHIEEGIDSVIEKYTGPLWKNRIQGIYRYV